MYVILVYDVDVERVNKVRIFLKKFLNWVQNSVFEGEVTKVELAEIESGLKDIIKKDKDSILVYLLMNDRYLERKIIGIEKVNLSEVI